MVYDLQLATGDICEDPTGKTPTGLLVRVEDIDIYDYVHFAVIESSTRGFDETESGEMSHVAFAIASLRLPICCSTGQPLNRSDRNSR
jgi:hypothetical protein